MALRSRTALGIAALFVMVATLFFWLAAMSTPITKSLWYLRANNSIVPGNVYLGNFGWSAGDGDNTVNYRHIGYEWAPYIRNKALSGSFFLVALTAAFGTIAFFTLLGAIRSFRLGMGAIMLTLFTVLLSTISFILILSTFVTAHRRFKNDGITVRYGPAFILSIIGWLLYLFSVPLLILARSALRRERDGYVPRDGVVHETRTTTTTSGGRRKFF